MTAPTFLDVLKAETMKFQASHPEREAEIARAAALIRLGMVTPSPADPATGQVLSSDGQKVYHVNGVCDCEAGTHGRECKHLHSWRFYQHIAGKVEAQTTPPAVLPEAPASVNVRVTMSGRECQITLRDTDEVRLLARLEKVLEGYPLPERPAGQAPASQGQDKGWCNKHQVTMQRNDKNGRTWYSHQANGQWCKGR